MTVVWPVSVPRRAVLTWGLLAACSVGCGGTSAGPAADGAWHVYPGESIQAALDRAAANATSKRVIVHAGTYRPSRPAQALVWLNRRHDGITLEALGRVVLTAENPELAVAADESFPAIVNHVVYFGDGISARTVLRGFTITGANRFQTRSDDPGPIEPNRPRLGKKNLLFFYCDGGGIKVFGRSYPRIERVVVTGNVASPCGAGLSIQHLGFQQDAVRIRDSIFRENRCQVTGSAINVLPGSRAEITNCLFVGNVANTGEDTVSPPGKLYNAEHGSGALTVFPGSRVQLTRCTLTGNWNGIDDRGQGNSYTDSIFWHNTLDGGKAPQGRYELDILDAKNVAGCLFGGATVDLRGTIDAGSNRLDAPDPQFDEKFHPRCPDYSDVGYRAAENLVPTRSKQR
ncbi:MAG: right-handed parallel beta-helix repeat-containing protein [Planctomycetaceae bacterium]